MKGYFVLLREWLLHEWLFASRMKGYFMNGYFVKFSEDNYSSKITIHQR